MFYSTRSCMYHWPNTRVTFSSITFLREWRWILRRARGNPTMCSKSTMKAWEKKVNLFQCNRINYRILLMISHYRFYCSLLTNLTCYTSLIIWDCLHISLQSQVNLSQSIRFYFFWKHQKPNAFCFQGK